MNPKTVARRAAIKVLATLESVDKPLGAILDALRLPHEAQSFAREIASGTVRHRARADWTLEPLLRKPLHKLDAPVRAALRLATYERCVLGTPARAVADEYAQAMRAARLVSAVAFVNAVARRLPDAWPASPDRKNDPVAFLTHEYSYPDWIVKRWLARLGFDQCAALCRASNEIAPLSLRVNTRRATREAMVASLQNRGLAARLGTVSPDAVVVERTGTAIGSPDAWPEWTAGHIIAQDEAAQLVSRFAIACLNIARKKKTQTEHTQPDNGSQGSNADDKSANIQSANFNNVNSLEICDLKIGDEEALTIVDACAAPGGKTTHLAQMLNDKAQIIACDLAPGRLKLVTQNAARLGLTSVSIRAGDFRALARRTADASPNEASSNEALPDADLVLLDAPCLGTGTLRRRPDAKWRKSASQLAELEALQRELLDAAALLVKPGGVLAYATCSLEPEENEEQAHAFLARHPMWQSAMTQLDVPQTAIQNGLTNSVETTFGTPDEDTAQVATSFVGSDGFLRTWPHRDGCDGAFAACFVRNDVRLSNDGN